MRHTLFLSLLFAGFIIAGCSSPDQPVSFEEAEKFSKQIDSSINYRNAKYFTSLINVKELGKRVEKSSTHKLSAGMERGIGEGLNKTDMGGQIIRQVEKKGSYELVKHYEKDKVQHLVYRLYSEEGLNYHDFELVKKNGKVSIADYYIYLAGENFSSMLANLLALFEKPSGKATDEYQSMQSLQRIKSLMNQGRAKEAKELFDQLSPQFRDQKTIRIIGMQLSSQIDNDIYLKELEDFQARYPNEPNTYLLTLDAAILNKDYEKALSNINHLDSLINKDKFLDFYRALMYNLMEEPAKAREYLELLVQNYPTFESGILELIANYLKANDYDKARPLIENFKKNETFDQDVLDAVVGMYPGYTG